MLLQYSNVSYSIAIDIQSDIFTIFLLLMVYHIYIYIYIVYIFIMAIVNIHMS